VLVLVLVLLCVCVCLCVMGWMWESRGCGGVNRERDGRERGGEWTKAKDIDVHVHGTRTRRVPRTVVRMGDGMG
jgi:hypothetical protein